MGVGIPIDEWQAIQVVSCTVTVLLILFSAMIYLHYLVILIYCYLLYYFYDLAQCFSDSIIVTVVTTHTSTAAQGSQFTNQSSRMRIYLSQLLPIAIP